MATRSGTLASKYSRTWAPLPAGARVTRCMTVRVMRVRDARYVAGYSWSQEARADLGSETFNSRDLKVHMGTCRKDPSGERT
jgi:hypothetical protein